MMVRKAFQKAGLIAGIQPGVKPQEVVDSEKPRTAPGTMMGFLTAQSSAFSEAEQLKTQVRALEEAAPIQKLDPTTIKPSLWANRHEASFATEDFQQLKAEILSSGGNIQPIKVRPVAGNQGEVFNGATPLSNAKLELVFGHRRHRACLELGLPVLALIEETTDADLFEQMERENRGRQNLSPWEQGNMYRKAEETQLYPSLRKMAEKLGVNVSLVSRSLTLAKLPDAVIAAFPTPLDIQFRWAAPLADAVQKDPEGVLAKAKIIIETAPRLNSLAVFTSLTDANPKVFNRATPPIFKIMKAGKKAAVLKTDIKGRVLIEIEKTVLPQDQHEALVNVIEDFLSKI
jgi:ParB family transcriptional regulator, chromosome partitioning protein